ncbi:MAG: globin [Proteobacteria bacterium]|nr:globin [Pseudomonadota bacterium]
MFDLAFPSIPSLSPSLFAVVGEASLRGLVRRHHERLRNSSIGHLFPSDQDRFTAVVEQIANFIVKTAAGLSTFGQSHGHLWLRAQHLPITIDETARNVWLAEMLCALDDVGFPDEARLEYWNWVEALSILVINRRTMITQPRRYPLAEASIALSPFMHARRGR